LNTKTLKFIIIIIILYSLFIKNAHTQTHTHTHTHRSIKRTYMGRGVMLPGTPPSPGGAGPRIAPKFYTVKTRQKTAY